MTAIILSAVLLFTPSDAKFAHSVATSLVDCCTPRDAGTPGGTRAARFIRDTVSSVASSTYFTCRLDPFEDASLSMNNVVAEYAPSKDGNWIVFVSHYDTKKGVACPGANDGASTSGLLAAMAFAAARNPEAVPSGVNLMFLWTDGEECRVSYSANDGLHGSRRAAEALVRSGRNVAAVICLDMLGDSDLCVGVPANCSFRLRDAAFAAARECGVEIRDFNMIAIDDHVPFFDRGFPAIDLIDFEYGPGGGSNAWWHTPQDTMDKVSEKSLLKAGRLAFALAWRIAGRK